MNIFILFNIYYNTMNIKYKIDINKYFNNDICNKIFDLIDDESQIGKGYWGNIYKIKIKCNLFSVKKQNMSIIRSNLNRVDVSSEVEVIKKLSQFKENNNVHFFPYYYHDVICNNNHLLFYQNYKDNINILFGSWTPELFKSIIYQCIYAIHLFQSITGFSHNDIHIGNFLLEKIDKPEIQYGKYNIKYYGYGIVLWDYGTARKINEKEHDIGMMKQMFKMYQKQEIYDRCDHNKILEFVNKYTFMKIYLDEQFIVHENKWDHIKNAKARKNFITASTIKSVMYEIIDADLLLTFIKFYKNESLIDIYIDPALLLWLSKLPNTVSECLNLLQ